MRMQHSGSIWRSVVTLLCLALLFSSGSAQQVADTSFNPKIESPAYAEGKGPLVFLDEAHFNFHTASGRYQTFARLLGRDGYTVKGNAAKFSRQSLQPANILVIANALAERNREDWTLPTPSAFTDEEIAAVRDWVKEGGALLLIADHMPFPGAAEKLAAAFGVRLSNGYVLRSGGGADYFKRADGTLKDHAITNGRNAAERIDTVRSFTGSAFQAEGAEPLMVLPDGYMSLLVSAAGQFAEQTPRVAVGGWYQGAVLRFGKGRVAVFGEAAMFSAQLAGANQSPMGMNAPDAKENSQFLLNVLHWLSGLLDGSNK